MALFAISDLHLDTKNNEKSMEVFGNRWQAYVEKIQKNWLRLVTENDTVIVPGDISWALNLEAALPDLKWIDDLPGQKILLKGNHDFWWSTRAKMQVAFLEYDIQTIQLLNNNAIETEQYILTGSRGWFTDRSMQNASQTIDYRKIVNREAIRLRMSLEHGSLLRQKSGKQLLTFLHFPPIWGEFCCEEIVQLLINYEITHCYFGHIHGCYTIPSSWNSHGIEFTMISADYLDFIPYFIG